MPGLRPAVYFFGRLIMGPISRAGATVLVGRSTIAAVLQGSRSKPLSHAGSTAALRTAAIDRGNYGAADERSPAVDKGVMRPPCTRCRAASCGHRAITISPVGCAIRFAITFV